jgi:dienelactone hydrolase
MAPFLMFLVSFLGLFGPTLGRAYGQELITPPNGTGPAVIVLSGSTGVHAYRHKATAIASLGYMTMLVDGKWVAAGESGGTPTLERLLETVAADPRVQTGKVAVVGFSRGGGGVLVHAAAMSARVTAVATFYPAISAVGDLDALGRQLKVPTLILAGVKDVYRSCCLIDSIRQIARAAKDAGGDVELVEYPEGRHGFNLESSRGYRPDDDADSWLRLQEFLKRHLPTQ